MRRLWSANGVYAFSRSHEGKTFIVALNASGSPQQVHVPYEAERSPKTVFGSASDISVSGERLTFTIPARSGAVLK